jgi:hypothetical protein
MKYVAFIGSRDLKQFSQDHIDLFTDTVKATVQHGYAIVTGACKGADQLAADTVLLAGGKVLLVLPYADYEWHWVQLVQAGFPDQVKVEVYDPAIHQTWTESVQRYHPAPDRLKEDGVQMHARNYGIVGRAISVVALPNYQKNGGGTAQGLRMATALKIKLFDLRDQSHCRELMRRLTEKPETKLEKLDRELLKAPGISAAMCVEMPADEDEEKTDPRCYCDQIPVGDPSHPTLCRYCD